MSSPKPKIRWSERVDPIDIRRLYESDAIGRLDEDLLNEVGFGIYARCVDMLEVSDAFKGTVTCRVCGNRIRRKRGKMVKDHHGQVHREGGEREMLGCGRCGWRISWGEYRKSVRYVPRLHFGRADIEDFLRAFVRAWPEVRSTSEKLLLVDVLIHEFHRTSDGENGCPLGVNVIRGTAMQVYTLLERLAYGPESTPGISQTRSLWNAKSMHFQYSKVELLAIARELGIKGRSGMRKSELIAAVSRADPKRFWAS